MILPLLKATAGKQEKNSISPNMQRAKKEKEPPPQQQ
jgi:hypothetical protein